MEPDILVLLDGDYTEQLLTVIGPILKQDYDMVIGSRARGKRESGSMTMQQVFGNWLATSFMKVIYKTDYSDLGSSRVIKWDKLKSLGMIDQNYGWTIEIKIKAAKAGLKTIEVPVDYRKRIGLSKVSGTIKGVIVAGYKILLTIWR
ncbi:hypothetical protein [Cognataquiflexum rubidum]|uniref:hypothetical protein n=1 Tax=Cognataquiflexum rubidum TaxID=2922273 RepID=UPI00300CCBD4